MEKEWMQEWPYIVDDLGNLVYDGHQGSRDPETGKATDSDK